MTTLLLLHGMGATAGVWAGLEAELDWPGEVRAVDLAGHGTADWSGDYTVGGFAAAVSQHCANREEVVIVGHSLGGAVGLCLASGFFRPVARAVIGLSIKMSWSDDDIAGMAKIAERGMRVFETRDEAVSRFLKVAGLHGVMTPTGQLDGSHPAVEHGVRQVDGGWALAQDPMTFAQRPVDMSTLMTAAACPVVLGAGVDDPMVTEADMAAHVERPRMVEGRGHSVHVEDPTWVAEIVREFGRSSGET